MIDLRKCGRVELWACESGFTGDWLGTLLHHHEPVGVATSFLLAGAHTVLGSWWKQPAWSASLIAAAFACGSGHAQGAAADARTLAGTIRSYRNVLGPSGPVETAMRAFFDDRNAARRAGSRLGATLLKVGWEAGCAELTGSRSTLHPVVVDRAMFDDAGLLAPVRTVDAQIELRREPEAVVARLLHPLRSPHAWAGWRVYARDRDCA